MGYKKNILHLLIVFVLIVLFCMVITNPRYFGFCNDEHPYCFGVIDDIIGQPLGIFSIVIIPILAILYFTGKIAFGVWKKFAMIYILISAILIATTPTAAGFLNPDREDVTVWLAGLFFIISIIIILVKREKGGSLNE